MADEGGRVYSDKKVAYAERLENLLATLPSVLLISADNVGSQQMHIVRAELRKEGQKAEVLMGKNTMIKFVIRRAAAQKVHCMLGCERDLRWRTDSKLCASQQPAFNKLADAIKLNVGLVFTDCEPKKVHRELATARACRPDAQHAHDKQSTLAQSDS
jgi:large subunit ribosomal protein LP0